MPTTISPTRWTNTRFELMDPREILLDKNKRTTTLHCTITVRHSPESQLKVEKRVWKLAKKIERELNESHD